jgi:UDP-N-acetylmuramate--alanine ligase
MEDYAHHPTELAASLQALRELYPGKYLMVVFQPHRNERVQRYGERFGHLLAQADWVGLTPAFGAWRTDGQTCDADSIIGRQLSEKHVYLEGTWEEDASIVSEEAKQHAGCVIAVIGAGDVTRIVPLLKSRLGL